MRAGRSRVGGFAGDDAERAAVHRGNHRQDRDAVERGEVGQFRAQEDALGNQRTHAGSDQQAGRTAAAVRRNTAPAGRLQHCIGVDPQETVWGGGGKGKDNTYIQRHNPHTAAAAALFASQSGLKAYRP